MESNYYKYGGDAMSHIMIIYVIKNNIYLYIPDDVNVLQKLQRQ